MKKIKWQIEKVVGTRRVYARTTRQEIVVRIENDGDTTKYAEWDMPKIFGLGPAIEQALLQTNDGDIVE